MSTTIKRHPDAVTMMSFAAGTLAEPLAAVVAAHIAMCPRCRKEVADLDMLGAALLARERTTPGHDVSGAKHRPMTAAAVMAPRKIDPAERLPGPIALAYGLTFADIPWKRLGPGVMHHRLPLSDGTTGDLRLLKIGPGRQMPDHGHGGAELTLVLDGAFSDATGHYACGDLQDVDEDIEHTPLTDKVAGCICLIASERPARFKSIVGRLMQPLTGM